MNASESAINLIKRFEGLRLKAYLCPAGVWTIGYGHTGADVVRGLVIRPATADALLRTDLSTIDRRLTDLALAAGITLSQPRFDALASFAFNLGIDALAQSTLWRKAAADPDDPTIPAEFLRWVYATVDGKKTILPGLQNRRRAEAALWQKGTAR